MRSMDFNRIAENISDSAYPRLELKATFDNDGFRIKVWAVDGEYIRTFIDEEFTNFGQHYRFGFIPEFEFWIDKEAAEDESKYFVEHLRTEWLSMREGKDYAEAIVRADNAERALRRNDAGREEISNPSGIIDPEKFRIGRIKALDNGLTVWLVDGNLVRTFLDIDFTEGGHGYVYEFVPPNDIWIDNDLEWKERKRIFHENEFNKMKEGWTYADAHKDSSKLEAYYRRNPEELHDALICVGWA